MSAPTDDYQPGDEGLDQPTISDINQNDYTSRTGQKQASVPVQSDNDPVDDPIDADTANSDEQLAKDDVNAIDQSNIINDRTRGAAKTGGAYREPGDAEGLGDPDDGRSAVAGGTS